MRTCPALRPRRDLRTWHDQCVGAAFRSFNSVGSRGSNYGAQSHGLLAPCVRFAVQVTRYHATLGSGRWPSFAGRGWLPAGFQ